MYSENGIFCSLVYFVVCFSLLLHFERCHVRIKHISCNQVGINQQNNPQTLTAYYDSTTDFKNISLEQFTRVTYANNKSKSWPTTPLGIRNSSVSSIAILAQGRDRLGSSAVVETCLEKLVWRNA